MSYIQPNTDIYILSNVPLNKDYENTVYYSDKETQANAFMNYQKHHLTNYSYQRALLGTIKVELKYEQLIDCNYMLFKNTNFENKWFYAFITGIGYISNDVTAIYYEIDVMQTWCYDYKFKKSFVERAHVLNESRRSDGCRTAEGLEIGSNYVTVKATTKFIPTSDSAFILTASNNVSTVVTPSIGYIDNVYTGLYTYYAEDGTVARQIINDFISSGKEDSIVTFCMCPKIDDKFSKIETEDVTVELKNQNGNYVPRNKKLLNYPYHFLQVYSTLGQSLDIHFEDYDSDDYANNPTLRFYKTVFPNPSYSVVPTHHLGTTYNLQYRLNYANFPTCAFSGDAYKSWWAQNKNSFIASMNAIGTNYDTQQAIASNNYTIAKANAQTSRDTAKATANTSLANATASTNTALAVNENNRQVSQTQNLVGMATNAISGATDWSPYRGMGTIISGTAQAFTNIYATEQSAQNTANTLNTSLSNSTASANTAISNAQLSYDTAIQNATLTQTNATLSNLSTAQIATSQLMAKRQDTANLPNTAHGNVICDGLNYAMSCSGFIILEVSIHEGLARHIDAYFDKYGYAISTMVASSQLNKRQWRNHWTYLKTCGAYITGKLNANDLDVIKGVYDNGVTTWNNLEEIGNYELDNTLD
jgi:hypothetical protein